jgi:hypothetical protein
VLQEYILQILPYHQLDAIMFYLIFQQQSMLSDEAVQLQREAFDTDMNFMKTDQVYNRIMDHQLNLVLHTQEFILVVQN